MRLLFILSFFLLVGCQKEEIQDRDLNCLELNKEYKFNKLQVQNGQVVSLDNWIKFDSVGVFLNRVLQTGKYNEARDTFYFYGTCFYTIHCDKVERHYGPSTETYTNNVGVHSEYFIIQ